MQSGTDARKLDIATQAHPRGRVVRAVRTGMSQARADEVFGASLRAVRKWMALDRAGGQRALKPVRRAYERNDAAIGGWLRTAVPAIARQARQERAVIYRGDENRAETMAGVRSHLRRRQRQPRVIRSLFQDRHVRYAA